MTQQPFTTLLRGGLDLVSPKMAVAPGRVIAGQNYVPDESGYVRLSGIERFDGRPKPHEAEVYEVTFDLGSLDPPVGTVIAGVTSGTTARIAAASIVDTGSFATSDAAGKFIVYDLSGSFTYHEVIEVRSTSLIQANAFQLDAFQSSGVPGTARATGAGIAAQPESVAQGIEWRRAAIELRREVIGPVPGSGPVRGVWALNGDVYAIRDNEAATAGGLWKATATGWAAQALGHILRFTTGTAAFEEGETVTGGTSTATGTVRRVVVESGDWATNDAAGFLVITVTSGTFQAAETITSASGSATASGAQAAITLPAGGRYDFTNANFYGAPSLTRMYGVNGVGRAFEFDGTTFTPIYTGLSDALDKPKHVAVYKNHLFLSYAGGSILFSGIGEPLDFSTSAGAGELAFGNEVTGMLGAAATALVLFGRSKIEYLVGNDAQDFQLLPLADDAGALEWTAQMAGAPTYVDDSGVRQMSTTQAFGDWRSGTLTRAVEPLFRAKRRSGALPLAAMRVRARDQYRLFFDDRTGLVIFLGRESPEVMPIAIPFDLSCAVSVDDADGYEVLFGGTETGYVVEFDAGTSFDGTPVDATMTLGFIAAGNVAQKKRFHRAAVFASEGIGTSIAIGATFDYGEADEPVMPAEETVIDSSGEAVAYLDGFGRAVSLTLSSSATYEDPHALGAVTINITPRGIKR